MHEQISETLNMLAAFSVIGFVLAFFYEPLRISRKFCEQNAILIGIEDLLFMAFAAIVMFAYSLELGGGTFRWYFVAGGVIGAAVYFFSLGMLISFFSGWIVKGIKAVWHFLIMLLKKIVNIISVPFTKLYNIIKEIFVRLYNNYIKHLQSRRAMKYNKRNTDENAEQGAVKRNVIQAEVKRYTGR
jgi:hypothetical protein